MGVVRREGDWRLEKRSDGVYEITYQKEIQLKAFTPDYRSSEFGGPLMDPFPTREVNSYSEVEGLFEEKAHGPIPGGLPGFDSTASGSPSSSSTDGIDDFGGTIDLEQVPPGLFAIVLVFVGGFTLYSVDTSIGSIVFLFSLGLVLCGIAIFAWAGVIYHKEGLKEATSFLFTADGGSNAQTSTENTEKTPSLSQRKKDVLYMDRAGRKCEWCSEQTNTPEVHHITPRAEGGPNEPENLIVLCPNCHREKAEVLSRSKFRRQVKRQIEGWDGF